jgi:predicted XRE-type DNA-binding protein
MHRTLAEAMGCSASHISHVLNPKVSIFRAISLQSLSILLDTFGMQIVVLMKRDPVSPEPAQAKKNAA